MMSYFGTPFQQFSYDCLALSTIRTLKLSLTLTFSSYCHVSNGFFIKNVQSAARVKPVPYKKAFGKR